MALDFFGFLFRLVAFFVGFIMAVHLCIPYLIMTEHTSVLTLHVPMSQWMAAELPQYYRHSLLNAELQCVLSSFLFAPRLRAAWGLPTYP